MKMDGARIQAITKKEMNDEREEKEKLSKKREQLNLMNLRQIDEYKQMLAKKKAEENAFALASNAGAIEKEKQDKLNYI